VKVQLKAGAELDVVSPEEAREIVKAAIEQAREAGGVEEPIRAEEGGVTDAAGGVTLPVYVVPIGREFVLTRILVDADGFTPGAPFVAAAGFVDVLRSGERVDFKSLAAAAGGLPTLSTDSKATGTRWRNGEAVEVRIVGGPANTTVRARVQGWLRTPAGDGQAGRTRRTVAAAG
jgi:hypothetical protein